MTKILLTMMVVTGITGCTITGPAEDQWDQEEKEDKVDLNSVFQSDKNTATIRDSKPPQTTDLTNNKSDDGYKEFLQYQEWRREQELNSQSYQEFKKYLQWKQENAE